MILILTRYYTLETSSDVIFPKYINSSPQKEDIQNAFLSSNHTHAHTHIHHKNGEICKSMHLNDD